MLYIEKTSTISACYRCDKNIDKGATAIYVTDKELYGQGVLIDVRKYWHPECFLTEKFDGKTGEQRIKELIVLFLPMLIEDKAVKEIVLALSIDKDLG